MSDIRVNIVQRTIRVGMTGGTSWNGLSGKPATFAPSAHTHPVTEVIADAFQTPVFANPLALNATSHKDFKPGLITGNTTVNLTNAVNGDGGVIELLIDAVGGYAVALGAMFVTKIGTASIVATANKKNYVFWFCDNATGSLTYSIQTV